MAKFRLLGKHVISFISITECRTEKRTIDSESPAALLIEEQPAALKLWRQGTNPHKLTRGATFFIPRSSCQTSQKVLNMNDWRI